MAVGIEIMMKPRGFRVSIGALDRGAPQYTAWVFYSDGTKIAAPSPLDPGTQQTFPLYETVGARCVRNFYSKSTLLLPRRSNREVGVVEGGSRSPKIDRVLRSPDPDDGSFGRLIEEGSADINGDGRADIVVRSDTKLWVLYGR